MSSLTRDEFDRECEELCRAFQAVLRLIEESVGDNEENMLEDASRVLSRWERLGAVGGRHFYLYHPPVRLKDHISVRMENIIDGDDEQLEENVLDDPDTANSPSQNTQHVQHDWRFSVVFSDTWRVPVLYFQVSQTNGDPGTRNEVLRLLDAPDIEDSWDFVSYGEHPATGEPWFFLHPCQTSARMGMAYSSTSTDEKAMVSKILSWMSMMLPAVGFRIPADLYLQLSHRIRSMRHDDSRKHA